MIGDLSEPIKITIAIVVILVVAVVVLGIFVFNIGSVVDPVVNARSTCIQRAVAQCAVTNAPPPDWDVQFNVKCKGVDTPLSCSALVGSSDCVAIKRNELSPTAKCQ